MLITVIPDNGLQAAAIPTVVSAIEILCIILCYIISYSILFYSILSSSIGYHRNS